MTTYTDLINANTIQPWRKLEIRRRTKTGYEAVWIDVTDYVIDWPVITFESDPIQPFTYRIGYALFSLRNDERQSANEAYTQSIFNGSYSRYKAMVRISTGLEDLDDGTQYPTSNAHVFYGLIEQVEDREVKAIFTAGSMMSILNTLPASVIASKVGVASTAKQLIETIRDYSISGSYVLQTFISSSAWLLTSTAETYTISTSTSLDNLTCFEFINRLAIAENHTFFIDRGGNFIFKERTYPTASSFTFKGPGQTGINIESLERYDEGVLNTYTKVTCNINSNLIINASETYTVGDDSSSWKYGVREFSYTNPYSDSVAAAIQAARLLIELKLPKAEISIRSKYVTSLIDIGDRVTFSWLGSIGGDGSTWDNFFWDRGLWSDENGGVFIDNEDFRVTSISINMNDFYTNFNLKKI